MREIPTLTKTRFTCLNGRPCRERADRSRDDRRYLMRRRWPQAAWPRRPGCEGEGRGRPRTVELQRGTFSLQCPFLPHPY